METHFILSEGFLTFPAAYPSSLSSKAEDEAESGTAGQRQAEWRDLAVRRSNLENVNDIGQAAGSQRFL